MEERIKNLRHRVNRARNPDNHPMNTCPASRHVHEMADCLLLGKSYPMFTEEPENCAESLLSVLESLWKARTLLMKHGIDPWGRPPPAPASPVEER